MTKLEIHVGGTFADTKRRVLDAVANAEKGPFEPQEHVTFSSWDALVSVMTTKRFELLRQLHKHPEASVASLARTLGRDYKRVHQDVESLENAGLIQRGNNGLRTGYDEIHTKIAL
jgi:predicted transcriptional regulator